MESYCDPWLKEFTNFSARLPHKNQFESMSKRSHCIAIAIGILFSSCFSLPAQSESVQTDRQLTQSECMPEQQYVWVAYGDNQSGCMRYFGGGLKKQNPSVMIFLAGDVDWPRRNDSFDPENAKKEVNTISAQSKYPYIFIARPGLFGSSGQFWNMFHTPQEIDVINATLDGLKARYGIGRFAIGAQSAGALITAGLLAKRTDIQCAVMASAPLSMQDQVAQKSKGPVTDQHELKHSYDPMQHIAEINRPAPPLYFVVDPADQLVPVSVQRKYFGAVRDAGIAAAWIEVESLEPTHHNLSKWAQFGAAGCIRGLPMDVVAKGIKNMRVKR